MIKRVLLSLTMTAVMIMAPAAAYADDSSIFAICKTNPNASICPGRGTTKDPVLNVIHVAANIIAVAAGIAAVVFIIISGITLITSSGNQEAVTTARRRLIAAIIGLVVIALAWTIINFTVNKLIK